MVVSVIRTGAEPFEGLGIEAAAGSLLALEVGGRIVLGLRGGEHLIKPLGQFVN